ncbi:hypothetical protein KP003_14290 [Geomonas nitrogeniifigens]|uniref:hypothetical protein n=1 Tax=Geomonas diazotrophica TaxID=2843197 RepID=UPI001C2C6733|nr:hypothetical protein [Geomonas nitrogeniifigens]QXE85546.1 hypothetical protein KP003_14290 [Geomonas nitrogeniifigens]
MVNQVSRIFLSTALVALSACSSGGGNSSSPSPSQETATVAGVDTNRDGVRDDIERHISTAHPDSAKTRSALKQYAKGVQASFVNVSTASQATAQESQLLRAGACVAAATGSAAAMAEIDALMANTPDRIKAREEYERHLEGKVFTIPSGDPATLCDVDPASLPN